MYSTMNLLRATAARAGQLLSLSELGRDVGTALGNLLCAVAHLLDQNPLLPAIQNILGQINGILAL